MNSARTALSPLSTLADLATSHAGASRVFHRHRLDFCCHGRVSLEAACAEHRLDVGALINELAAEQARDTDFRAWDDAPLGELIAHLLGHYHQSHREELVRLHAAAAKVEHVHAAKASCPHGLAEHLARMHEELEDHMQKEEQVLFPMVASGRGALAAMPVQVLESEHRDHALNLQRMRKLAHDFSAPEEACGTWRALYLGLAALERDLMQHIHLENNVLFPRALRS
ncbi:MAG: iron-sulfur cluster repair protein YtfE [Planctomycetes bacterium]|nr:iron-sulfur cluster repair protein YtfE [Planctomycetota bacterium]